MQPQLRVGSAPPPQETSMTQKAVPQTGSNDATSGSGLPPQEASTALKEGLVSGARDISSEVKHIASDVAEDAKKAAESKIGAGKDFAAEHLGAVAYALRHASQQLRSEESGITEYVEKAASSVDNVSHYLQTRTLSQLIGDVEGYARREPAVFLGGAFFAGLLGGRFLKSATPSRTSGAGNQARQGASPGRQAQAKNGPPQLGQGTPQGSTSSAPGGTSASPPRPATNGDRSPSQSSASTTPGGTGSPAASKTEPQGPSRNGNGPGVS
jgi:hypothetical protein